jgi:hypothetical protein
VMIQHIPTRGNAQLAREVWTPVTAGKSADIVTGLANMTFLGNRDYISLLPILRNFGKSEGFVQQRC